MEKKLTPNQDQFEIGILFSSTMNALSFFKELVDEAYEQLCTGSVYNIYWPKELFWDHQEVHLLVDNDQHTPESYIEEVFRSYPIQEYKSWPGN